MTEWQQRQQQRRDDATVIYRHIAGVAWIALINNVKSCTAQTILRSAVGFMPWFSQAQQIDMTCRNWVQQYR